MADIRSGRAYERREASDRERREVWMRSPEGLRGYAECRAKAQAYADLTGLDAGIELLWNGGHPGLVSWSWFGLPAKHERFGHETTCEVVYPTDIANTKPGHGYAAKRPPSLVGPDYHDGPWVGPADARRLNREFDAWWAAECRRYGVRMRAAGKAPRRLISFQGPAGRTFLWV